MSQLQRSLLGRYASLESDAVDPAADDLEIQAPEEGTDETGAQLDGDASVEGEILDAADDKAEVEEADADADELEETAESLESFLMAAQVGKKQGGWSTQEAMAYGLGMDAAFKRAGLSSDDLVPSVESFGGSERERIDQTTAVENRLKDALVQVWEAIKRAINRVIAFVRKWYTKIFDGASRLKRRAQAISKKAQATNGSASEKKISVAGYAQLHVNKSIPTASDLVSTLQGYRDFLASLSEKNLGATYKNLTEDLGKALTELANGSDGVTQAEITAIREAMNKSGLQTLVFPSQFKAKKETSSNLVSTTAGSDVDVFKTTELPGGICLVKLFLHKQTIAAGDTVAVASEKAKKNLRYLGKVMVVDASAGKKVELDNSKEFPILSLGDITHIADAVVEVCDKIIDYKLGFESYEKHNSKLLSDVDNAVRKANNGDDAKGRERNQVARDIATGVGAVIRNRGTSMSTVIDRAIITSRAALAYGLQSLGQYKD